MINRRSLLLGVLAAPAIVRASSLMPIYIPPIILYGDGKHCDAAALNAWGAGKRVLLSDGAPAGNHLRGMRFLLENRGQLMFAGRGAESSITYCHFITDSRPVGGASVMFNVV